MEAFKILYSVDVLFIFNSFEFTNERNKEIMTVLFERWNKKPLDRNEKAVKHEVINYQAKFTSTKHWLQSN